MFTVKTLNKISNVGLSKFDEAKYTIDWYISIFDWKNYC